MEYYEDIEHEASDFAELIPDRRSLASDLRATMCDITPRFKLEGFLPCLVALHIIRQHCIRTIMSSVHTVSQAPDGTKLWILKLQNLEAGCHMNRRGM